MSLTVVGTSIGATWTRGLSIGARWTRGLCRVAVWLSRSRAVGPLVLVALVAFITLVATSAAGAADARPHASSKPAEADPNRPDAVAAAVPVARWSVAADQDPLALAVAPDGGSLLAASPRRTQPDFEALSRRDATGALVWEGVPRDTEGRELRPVAVEFGLSGRIFAASADTLVALDALGGTLWDAPAGDGHPDFGPAARGLSLSADGGTLYGTDLVRPRVLGYRAENGSLRYRLGAQGVSPGSYETPVDVAMGPGRGAAMDRIFVAERGNRRIQVSDAQGNPLFTAPLPARPRALAISPDGDSLYVALEDETLRAYDPADGRPGGAGGWTCAGCDWTLRFEMLVDLGATDERVYALDRAAREIVVLDRHLHADPGTVTPSPTPTPSGSPEPETLRLRACPGRPARFDMPVFLPPSPPRADVMLVFDTTGSMESLISTAQTRAREIADLLRGVSPDVAIGVLDVRDYPYGEAGLASDWPWLLRGPISTEPRALETATARLWPGGGGDSAEAYAGAIARALDDPRAGWREGARRFVVLLGDSVPRDDDLNEGIASPKVPGRWAPGRPAWWRDSGPDWAPGTADDIDWQTLLARLRDEEVTLLAGINGAAPVELGGITGDLADYWRDWAGRAAPGGGAVDLSNVGRLPRALADMVADAGLDIERLALAVTPAERAAWPSASPPEYRDILVAGLGITRTFAVAIEAPALTTAGRYDLTLSAIGNGGRYARQRVELDWSDPCSAEPTDPPPSATPSPSPSSTATPRPSASATPSATVEASPTPARRFIHLPVLMKRLCVPKARPPLDVLLVLDTSSSMEGEKLRAALAAAGGFVDLLDLPRDHVGVVTFNRAARLDARLTGSRSLLTLALASPVSSPGTRIDAGLDAAIGELSSERARPEGLPVIVLLTDGQPDASAREATLAAAARARARGIQVYTIGLGGDVDAGLLRALAGDPARFFSAPRESDLERIYEDLAGEIPCG